MSAVGTALLSIVLVASLAGATSWIVAARGADDARSRAFARGGRLGILLAFAAAVGATAVVVVALLRHDTSLNYVELVSGTDLPAYYRVSALWSALEGSLLLWLVILSTVSVLGVRRGSSRTPRADAVAGAVLSLLTGAFAVISLMASPFAVPDAAVSAGPSPLLQDHVAMGIHPPLLYAGALTLAVPYARTLGALAARELSPSWADQLRRWSLVAWCLLTAGIVLGAWWSYAVLGWGGYWAWDPVENASLLPWLTTTALLHTVAPRTRSGNWRGWAAGLAGASFVLVLLATFLTRSGVVESIHAFSTSSLGPALGVIVLGALTAWLVLLGRRERDPSEQAADPVLSRPSALRLQRLLMVLITLVVLAGTLLPSILQAITGERLSVGPPWYHRTLGPVALLLLVAMAIGPWLPHRGQSTRSLAARIRIPALVSALALGAVALLLSEVWLAVGAGIASFAVTSLILASRRRDRLAIGSWISHTGLALAAVAVLAGGMGSVAQQSVSVGGTVSAGSTTATVLDLAGRDDGRRSVAVATVAIGEEGEFLATVQPELRWYEAERTLLTGPEIRTTLLRDVYVTLLDYDEAQGLVTIRLAVTPLVSWIWIGTGVMVIGAVVAGWPTRRRRRPVSAADPTPSARPGVAPDPARDAQEASR